MQSLQQTRLHFQNILAGFTEADEAARVDWKEDRTPRPKAGDAGDEKRSGKGKERVLSPPGGTAGAGSSGGKGEKGGKKGDAGGSGSGSGSGRKKRRSGG